MNMLNRFFVLAMLMCLSSISYSHDWKFVMMDSDYTTYSIDTNIERNDSVVRFWSRENETKKVLFNTLKKDEYYMRERYSMIDCDEREIANLITVYYGVDDNKAVEHHAKPRWKKIETDSVESKFFKLACS